MCNKNQTNGLYFRRLDGQRNAAQYRLAVLGVQRSTSGTHTQRAEYQRPMAPRPRLVQRLCSETLLPHASQAVAFWRKLLLKVVSLLLSYY